MTYLFYKSSTTGTQVLDAKTVLQLEHLANKKNWRITQLPNGFYQTECLNPEAKDQWRDVTRRETIEGAESAINASISYFQRKVDEQQGPKVVKTFDDVDLSAMKSDRDDPSSKPTLDRRGK